MRCITVLFMIFMGVTVFQPQQQETSSPTVLIAEDKLRARLVESPLPEFPQTALTEGAGGPVIAAVRFDEEGNMSKIWILKSPHRAIEESVEKALKTWRIKPYDRGMRAQIRGEFRFNFVIEDGVGVVRTFSLAEQRVRSKEFMKKFHINGQ
jgi:TonB family protein